MVVVLQSLAKLSSDGLPKGSFCARYRKISRFSGHLTAGLREKDHVGESGDRMEGHCRAREGVRARLGVKHQDSKR